MFTKTYAEGSELCQNNASSATESSPKIPLALGFSKTKRLPYSLYDIIFKPGNPAFCTNNSNTVSNTVSFFFFFFSEKGNSDV